MKYTKAGAWRPPPHREDLTDTNQFRLRIQFGSLRIQFFTANKVSTFSNNALVTQSLVDEFSRFKKVLRKTFKTYDVKQCSHMLANNVKTMFLYALETVPNEF